MQYLYITRLRFRGAYIQCAILFTTDYWWEIFNSGIKTIYATLQMSSLPLYYVYSGKTGISYIVITWTWWYFILWFANGIMLDNYAKDGYDCRTGCIWIYICLSNLIILISILKTCIVYKFTRERERSAYSSHSSCSGSMCIRYKS